ncbi:MAG TPA: VOC family protein [Edaphobacter sp.]|jgi:catechol 2,3-dioxygenase-like lactoylglutathione lyase family enzyme|nr:VOC family protein [Edaphobacter sp.]
MRRNLLLACLLSVPALAQQPTRPAITGVAFARFYTTDPTAAQKFYASTLGLERKETDGMWLYPVNHSQWIEVLTTPAPPQPNVRMAAVAFTTDDAAKLERYLEAHNIKPEVPLKNGQFGVRDPEGNLVIFVQQNSEKLVARALASPSATSTRIIHVGFIVTDRANEDAFWQQILGFRPYWHGGPKDDGVDNWVSLQVPDGTDWVEYMLNAGPNPSLHQAGVMDHFSLGVSHMSDAVAELARNHCEGPNCAKTQVGRDGKVQLNLYDPDQTRVEFMEFAPTQEPCCSPFTGKHPTPGDPNN